MKASGIIRHVDDLGRVVIPREMRRTLAIKEGAPMEIYVDKDCIIFKKYEVAGDMEQVLDNLESTIHAKGDLLTLTQREALVSKVAEMKALLNTASK